MHHNSQKRINTSKLFWDLGDLTLTQQSQKHPSASLQQLCVHSAADSAAAAAAFKPTHPTTQVFLSPSFFNLSVYLCCSCKALVSSTALMPPLSLFLPLILPTSYLQRFIKDYLTIYIQQYHQWRGELIGWVLLSALWVAQACVHARSGDTHSHMPPSSKDGIFLTRASSWGLNQVKSGRKWNSKQSNPGTGWIKTTSVHLKQTLGNSLGTAHRARSEKECAKSTSKVQEWGDKLTTAAQKINNEYSTFFYIYKCQQTLYNITFV